MALGSSVYKLIFDTQGLENVTASRREIALKKKIMEETTPVVDKLAAAEANLNRLVAKDLITLDQKNVALAKVERELTGASKSQQMMTTEHLNGIPVVGRYASVLATLGPIGLVAATGSSVARMGIDLLTSAISYSTDKVKEQLEALDDLINSADKFSLPVVEFHAMTHAAGLADIKIDKFNAGFETMLANVSKASSGKLKQVEAFGLVGLDAQKLKDQAPDEILNRVTTGLSNMANASDRLRAAKGIFGDSDFTRFDSSDLLKAQSILQDIGFHLTELDKHNLNQLDDSVNNLNFTVDSLWKKVAIGLSPALNDAAVATQKLLIDAASDDKLSPILDRQTTKARGLVVATEAAVKEVGQLMMPESASQKKPQNAIDRFWERGGILGTLLSAQSGNWSTESNLEFAGQMKQIEDMFRQMKSPNDRRGNAAKSPSPLSGTAVVEESDATRQAVDAMNDKLREQIAIFGKSTAEAELYKLSQIVVKESTLDETRALVDNVKELSSARDLYKDLAQSEERRRQAVQGIISGLTDETSKLRLSARAQLDRRVAMAGGGILDRVAAIAIYDQNEALRKNVDASKAAAAAAIQRAGAVRGIISGIEDEIAKVNMSERAYHDRQVALAGGGILDRVVADAAFQRKKEADATKTATDAIKELTKEKRQFGMTDREKKLDDLKTAGVADEQLKIVDGLLKEKELREKIRQDITATGFALKANSREAVDAFAKANQIAVRERFLREQLNKPSPAPSNVSTGAVVITATPMPPKPVILDSTDRPADPVDPFAEAYRLSGKTDPLVSSAQNPPIAVQPMQTLEKLTSEQNSLLRQLVAKTTGTSPTIEDPTL